MILPMMLLLVSQAHADWKLTACQKACIPPHDTKVIACKTVKTKQGTSCVAKADRERRACEASCAAPSAAHPVKPVKATPVPGKP